MARGTTSAQTPLRQDSKLQFQFTQTLFQLFILFFQQENLAVNLFECCHVRKYVPMLFNRAVSHT